MDKFFNKQLKIFLIITFALPYILGILMGFGYNKGINLIAFPSAQMFYPAAGVMLAALITRKKDQLIPKRFFISFIVVTILMIICAIGSIVEVNLPWNMISQYIILLGSIVSGIFLLTEKKVKREAYGLKSNSLKISISVIILFIIIYLARTIFSYIFSGETDTMINILKNPYIWITAASLPLNYFLVFAAFFGEEYGWRYYLQPILQKKFGIKIGVIILGIVWGLWHLPINLFYYSTPSDGLISILGQQVTCITLGAFFAYTYMKTNNIWVPVALHFLNNNLVPIITGTLSADVLENQQMSWEALLFGFIINSVLFMGFLLTKYFKNEKYLLPTMDERADLYMNDYPPYED
ncbi:membrane protease YdiL (CAAX protease family) [Mobilisporobacter senegalensis]|uniref:Membrane protease YdiL (CAAX protease family) n=1 Tax=Mobilisporobacter senegalensis TaxID=1329262 RepID=A0A3N1X5Q6_9FIRM|nr:type II CAAX endopeptidase family protein [Mobilisporobacter senegalensis]ROR22116.1 membrane protease YdiL (CAAX protease family) [Mobilisporobacter senegalensis]